MNFHDNTLWQKAYMVLMDIYEALDTVDEEVLENEEESVESLLVSAQDVAAKIADGLSRKDRRIGKELLFDAIGLVAVVRTHLAIAWGRGLLEDDMFRSIDGKYQALSEDLQQ